MLVSASPSSEVSGRMAVDDQTARRSGGYMIGFSGIGYRAADELGLLPCQRSTRAGNSRTMKA